MNTLEMKPHTPLGEGASARLPTVETYEPFALAHEVLRHVARPHDSFENLRRRFCNLVNYINDMDVAARAALRADLAKPPHPFFTIVPPSKDRP